MTARSKVDHLVVAADTLAAGVAWCRETFGFEPTAGGEHPLMGTHNRVFRIATPAYRDAYFEIIAIDPAGKPPPHARWFDLDSPRLRAAIAKGPRLIHFVASTNDAGHAVSALAELGIDRGPLLAAERPTPAGLLQWRITVRTDGARLYDGILPTLIEWRSAHPAQSLPDCGVALRAVHVTHPEAALLKQAFDTIGLEGVHASAGTPGIVAVLDTPRGPVRLESKGI